MASSGHLASSSNIMSTGVLQRRGNPRLSKNHANTITNGDAHQKRAKKSSSPVLVGTIVALFFVVCIVLLPRDSGSGATLRSPSDLSVQRVPITITSKRKDQPILHEQLNTMQRDEKDETRKLENLESTHVEHHMIFSTGCTTFQDWQSYIFFFHAMKSGQPGHVTRIASGCKPEEAEELRRLHKERIGIMSDKFHLHLTPDYMKIIPGKSYKFFNKPYGVRHWMEDGLGYPENTDHDDVIVILMDPDQMLLRPLTYNFTDSVVNWKPTKEKTKPKMLVEHGTPFGQLYGYAAQWRTKVNVTHVAGPNSPIEVVTMNQARDYYPLGPPYMATARDFYKIVVKWTEFVVPTHDDYPHLLAEMFAYSLAAAHCRLPHQIAKSFVVSDPVMGSEGWSLMDPIPDEDVCYNVPRKNLPHVLHYCHRYLLGKWFISKYKLRRDFVSCESPLLMEPPGDIAVRYNYDIAPQETKRHYKTGKYTSRRMAFMLCAIIKGLNEAAEFFKKNNCEEGANFEKSYIFHASIEE